ncbi:hypothetical protein MLD38_018774 [Melastoma candidum]|uniref:Uncharacterized protein n=1 Tax=Melastoma candidum TaxID=119954 RepID=A0ACB9QUX8_9MYRT|nr:hypothetical protein MLD38_018774 [Melastoma candidum]
MGTYRMLIQVLDMEHRSVEACQFWEKKIGNYAREYDWNILQKQNAGAFCKGLEAFDQKPPEKSVVQRVANDYEALGLLDEKTKSTGETQSDWLWCK